MSDYLMPDRLIEAEETLTLQRVEWKKLMGRPSNTGQPAGFYVATPQWLIEAEKTLELHRAQWWWSVDRTSL
jgi:hypothetical protein